MQPSLAELVFKKSRFHLRAEGESMLPFFRSHDIVYYRRLPFSRIRVNDIVLVREGGRYFTHRVIYKGADTAVTQGDNNRRADRPVPAKHIVAVVERVRRGNRVFHPDALFLLQSAAYQREIMRLNRALSRAGLPFLYLKGLPLAYLVTGAPPRRVYADCDLLVAPDLFAAARRVFHELGYREADTSLSPLQRYVQDKRVETTFVKQVGGIPVVFDVHTEPVFLMTQIGSLDRLYPSRLLCGLTRQFMAGKRMVTAGGVRCPLLGESDLLVYLCLHFFHHNWRGIYRLELMNAVVKRLRTREHAVIRTAAATIRAYRLEGYVLGSLLMLERYYPERRGFVRRLVRAIKPASALASACGHIPDVFKPEGRGQAGIARFANIFRFSPEPLVSRVIGLFNPQVLFMMLLVGGAVAGGTLQRAMRLGGKFRPRFRAS